MTNHHPIPKRGTLSPEFRNKGVFLLLGDSLCKFYNWENKMKR